MPFPSPRCPAPLRAGDQIAVTAPSSPVPEALWPRLQRALDQLQSRGYPVVEGASLRRPRPLGADDAESRAAELMDFCADPAIAAVLPPWGGELAMALLPHLDYARLAELPPKWFCGFSDLSTLQLPLLLRAGWQSVHGPNLMELAADPLDPVTARLWDLLETAPGRTFTHNASTHYQRHHGADWREQPSAGLQLDTPTRWQRLDGRLEPLTLQGRLLGGCLDTLSRLPGSACGDVPGWAAHHAPEGVLYFFENAEMRPLELARTLIALRLQGWLQPASGVLIGRDAAASPADTADRLAVLQDCLGSLPAPVLFDVDIGHLPPQFSLLQGALASVHYDGCGGGWLTQQRP